MVDGFPNCPADFVAWNPSIFGINSVEVESAFISDEPNNQGNEDVSELQTGTGTANDLPESWWSRRTVCARPKWTGKRQNQFRDLL